MSGVLEVDGLTKRWAGMDAPVLDEVDLSIERGSAISIRGRNGAGKTTLLRILAGLITPDGGSLRLEGLDPERNRRSFQERVGFVSAGNGALYARLTVDDHLELWSKLSLLDRRTARRAMDEVGRAFDLEELRRRRLDRLSTGQRQRLRLSLGFMHEPTLVLLDEPAVSLDDTAKQLLDRAIAALRERGGIAIVCGPTGTAEDLDVELTYVLGDGRLERT